MIEKYCVANFNVFRQLARDLSPYNLKPVNFERVILLTMDPHFCTEWVSCVPLKYLTISLT